MEKITVEIPIISVKSNEPYFGAEYAKEHYKEGLFLVDDGIGQSLCVYDGVGYVWNMPFPVSLLQDGIEVEAAKKERERCADVLEGINDRLDVIEKLCNDTNSEMYKQKESRVKGFKALSERFDSIEGKLSNVSKGGEGVNILDVARAAAVIQKPELIKELNK